MNARDEVLRRVRAARPTAPVQVPRGYDVSEDGADPVELFADRVADYRATVRRCTSDTLAGTIADLLVDVPRVVVAPGVPGGWLSAYPGTVVVDGDPAPLSVTDLDAPSLAVLTGCAVAVATTGTLILDAGPAQGRRLLTLVPDHHVCVVHVAQVVIGVPAALRRIARPTRPLTLISGPSATSDIELNRVEGVHGPRRLDVVVCDERL
jgi:L-lactate dehydrogenase complex protein LldG